MLITVNFIDFTARLNSHDTHTDSVVRITPKQNFAGPLVGAFFVGMTMHDQWPGFKSLVPFQLHKIDRMRLGIAEFAGLKMTD